MAKQNREGELVDIVNEQNQIVTQATRQEIIKRGLRHRANYIVVYDGMDELKILVQKRAYAHKKEPKMLEACVKSMVSSGQDTLKSARNEAEKELGIADIPFAEHGTFYFESNIYCVWGTLLSCVSHGPFAIDHKEIEEVYWMKLEEIEQRKEEFTADSIHSLSLWLNRRTKEVETIHIEIE